MSIFSKLKKYLSALDVKPIEYEDFSYIESLRETSFAARALELGKYEKHQMDVLIHVILEIVDKRAKEGHIFAIVGKNQLPEDAYLLRKSLIKMGFAINPNGHSSVCIYWGK